MPVLMTRLEIEQKLETKYLGKVISFCTIRDKIVAGKIHSIAVDIKNNEIMIIFVLGHDRYEVDAVYFMENTTLHGNTPGRDTGTAGV
jgi:hypothetical protein